MSVNIIAIVTEEEKAKFEAAADKMRPRYQVQTNLSAFIREACHRLADKVTKDAA